MNEMLLAINVVASCADGSVHNDVTMKRCGDKIVFATADGEHLCGDCCVKDIEAGTIIVNLMLFAIAMATYRKQEGIS